MTTDDKSLHVIGAGLIGTSVALGARQAGYRVSLSDADTHQEQLARDLLQNHDALDSPSLVVVAVPPKSTAAIVVEALNIYSKSIVVDVASTKSNIISEVQRLSANFGRFVASHPIAGREVGGAASAQADLFEGRPWVITPWSGQVPTSREIRLVQELATALGATTYSMTPEDHDKVFADISHLPQIISTALAAMLQGSSDGLGLAGQGLRDMTRLAESDVRLWSEIFASNKEMVLDALHRFEISIRNLRIAIKEDKDEELHKIFDSGRRMRQEISGKHGSRKRTYSLFRIVIDDRPGVLAELFLLCGRHQINIEDLDLEHSPNQETGLITLFVHPSQSAALSVALGDSNWRFHLEEPKS